MTKKDLYIDSGLGVLILLVFLTLLALHLSFFESIDQYLFDLGMKLTPKTEISGKSKVTLIEIDDYSIWKMGQDSWTQAMVADAIDKLHISGVKSIALHIPLLREMTPKGLKEVREFREKIKVYPFSGDEEKALSWFLSNFPQLEEKLDQNLKLLNSVKEAGNVIFPVYRKEDAIPDSILNSEDILIGEHSIIKVRLSASTLTRIPNVEKLAMPYPQLLQQAAGLGFDEIEMGKQDYRSYPLFARYHNTFIPGIPLRMVMAYFNHKPSQSVIEESRVQIGNHDIPLYQGVIWAKPIPSVRPYPVYSLSNLLDGKIPPDLLKEKMIILSLKTYGLSPAIYSSSGTVPVSQWMAWIIHSMLQEELISRPSFLIYLEIMLLFIFGLIVSFVFPRCNSINRLVGMIALNLIAVFCSMMMLAFGLIWLKASYFILCIFLIYAVISIRQLFSISPNQNEAIETNRLLALSLQSQGHLDQAFEKFKKMPLDSETKDLIYKLGLEYEQKRLPEKALTAYEYIHTQGPFRDASERIAHLKELEGSSTIGSHGGLAEASILRDTPPEERSKVGRYKILSILGRGSMGLVYKALDPKINRILAIKTIRFSDEFEEEVIYEIKSRFFREGEIAGQLSHPSIVTVFDVGEDGDLTYMVMEYLEGNDLTKFISKDSLLPFRKVLDVVADVADALDYAHKSEVIHRDIKPANIMLLRNGGVKVTDFGIAKAISSSRTKTGVILGTPNYMSPEQIMGQKIDARSDIFSLGVLFYQLLVGRTPFQGESLSNLLYQITQIKHPSIQSINPRIPAVCERIIDKTLAKNPDDRFQEASEIAKYIRLLAAKIDQLKKVESTPKKN